MGGNAGGERLRIVIFNNVPIAYRTVVEWAERQGHTIALVVTSPGPPTRRSNGYREIAAEGPPAYDVLVTTRLRRVAAPLIAALAPDLIFTASFPHRLPPEILRLPRCGAINLHPSPLPAYRGPNPMRQFYDGATMGATVHRMDEDFDTGPILSQHTAPFPEDATPAAIFGTWGPLVAAAVEEGAARAVAGDPGRAQGTDGASYSPEFGEEEYWLDWSLPVRTLQRRVVALNFLGPQARATIAGEAHRVVQLAPVAGRAGAAPGTVLEAAGDEFTLAAGDGAVRVVATPLTD